MKSKHQEMTHEFRLIPAEPGTTLGRRDLTREVNIWDEHGLVLAAKRGRAGAFDALCLPHAKMLFQRTYSITRNREDAEDAVQDSFLRAFIHLKKFDGRSSFSTWVTRIAINSALMILRKKRSSREIAMEVPGELGATRFEGQSADYAPNPEQTFAQREKEEILRAAIRDLRPAVREAVEIQHLQEASMKEAASRMGISIGATKGRLFHGRAKLRKALRLRMRKHGSAEDYLQHGGHGLRRRAHGLPS
jgi:RNA polymerase sigma-70 factor, ECF subfamily